MQYSETVIFINYLILKEIQVFELLVWLSLWELVWEALMSVVVTGISSTKVKS